MAASITPVANMSLMVTIPRSTLQLKSLHPSVNFKNVQKCTSATSNITLSSSILFSGSFRFVPVMLPSSLFPTRQRRTDFTSSAQGDAQSTEDPVVENSTPDVEVEVEAEAVSNEEFTEESSDDEIPVQDASEAAAEEESTSAVEKLLQSYKEALLINDQSKVDEVESFLQALEEEKKSLANQVGSLSEELFSLKDKVLRISADFDNYRKRTERDRLSLVTNGQGEVLENLLPVLDNFERAKTQIKLETEGEEKINNSYQSIYKQFGEILASLGVVPVETVGSPFDPMLHEAIMREDSSEFEEGIILQEFRKGFKLGDRLLRPSMVKVSAGPGPAKSEEAETSGDAEASNETTETEESS